MAVYLDRSPGQALRAALYLRVSLDRYARLRARNDIEDRGSIPRQERTGRDLIDRMGWSLAAVRFDPIGASEYTAREREQWPEVLAMVDAGQLDVVVLWETSRGDRKLTTWSGFLDSCKARGVLIHILDHGETYDVRKPRDWEILAEEGIRNARESHKISSRVRDTKAELRLAGRPEGAITYGLRSVYDQQTGILLGREIDPEPADEVRYLFARRVEGAGTRELEAEMRERYPHRSWTRSNIGRMLRNVRYVGLIRDGDELRKAQWPAIIDPEMFWEIQEQNDANRATGARPYGAVHLCSYIATGACQGKLTWQQFKKAPARKPIYYCEKDKCVAVREDWLDEYIAAKVIAYWSRPGIRAALEKRAIESTEALAQLHSEREKLQARLAEIGREGATLPLVTVREMTRTVQQQLEQVQQRLESSMSVSARPLLEGDTEAEVEAAWHRLTVEGKIAAQRMIIRGTFQRIVVYSRGGGGWGSLDPRFIDAPYITR